MPKSPDTQLAVMASQMDRLQKDLSEIKTDVKQIRSDNENQFVTKDEFEPIKRVVYGMVSLVLVGVIGAILALVIRK